MIEFLVYIFLTFIYIAGIYFSYSHVNNLVLYWYENDIQEHLDLKQKVKYGFIFWILFIGFPIILIYLLMCLFFYITYSILIKIIEPND